VLACRQWIDRLATEYGRYRAVFLAPTEATQEQAGEMYHPCVSGLIDHLDAIIESEFYDDYRRVGSLDAAREMLRYRSIRLNFDLAVANVARCKLGDVDRNHPDWFRPYINAYAAFWEASSRHKLGLPPLGSTLAIMSEQVTLRENLLKGYKFPLDGVERAEATAR
jgi:hypothetical protein